MSFAVSTTLEKHQQQKRFIQFRQYSKVCIAIFEYAVIALR